MATFTVQATGTEPITYQWEEDNAGDNNFVAMVGETSNTLTVSDASVNQYRVVVTNPCGEQTSNVVKVIEQEAITLVNEGTIPFSGFGTNHLLVEDTTGNRIVFNIRGHNQFYVSTDGGDTWGEYGMPRSYNSGYPCNWMGYDPNEDRWWGMPYRSEIRATALSWSTATIPWGGASYTEDEWWGDPGSPNIATNATQDIFNTYAHGGTLDSDGFIYLFDMQSQDNPGIWRWEDPPNIDPSVGSGTPLINNGPESGRAGDPQYRTGNYAKTVPLNRGDNSCWTQFSFGGNHPAGTLGLMYSPEGGTPQDYMTCPKAFTDGDLTRTLGTNVGEVIPVLGDSGVTSGGSGRIAVQSATVARVLREVNAGGTPGQVRFVELDDSTTTSPDTANDIVYEFGKSVRTPMIGYDATEGWIVTAIDAADTTKLLVMKNPGDTPIELQMDVALDADDQDRQLMWSTARSSWLLAQTRNPTGGESAGLKMVLVEIKGV